MLDRAHMSSFAAQYAEWTLVVSDGSCTNSSQADREHCGTSAPWSFAPTRKWLSAGVLDVRPASSFRCLLWQKRNNYGIGHADNVSSGSLELRVPARATDCSGNSRHVQSTVTVMDAQPPDLAHLFASPAILWPPNHKLVSVAIKGSVTDTV